MVDVECPRCQRTESGWVPPRGAAPIFECVGCGDASVVVGTDFGGTTTRTLTTTVRLLRLMTCTTNTVSVGAWKRFRPTPAPVVPCLSLTPRGPLTSELVADLERRAARDFDRVGPASYVIQLGAVNGTTWFELVLRTTEAGGLVLHGARPLEAAVERDPTWDLWMMMGLTRHFETAEAVALLEAADEASPLALVDAFGIA